MSAGSPARRKIRKKENMPQIVTAAMMRTPGMVIAGGARVEWLGRQMRVVAVRIERRRVALGGDLAQLGAAGVAADDVAERLRVGAVAALAAVVAVVIAAGLLHRVIG
jgi:hypothetical protein